VLDILLFNYRLVVSIVQVHLRAVLQKTQRNIEYTHYTAL
jgi:hypothetical protein